jgi:hypothetical protein
MSAHVLSSNCSKSKGERAVDAEVPEAKIATPIATADKEADGVRASL